MAAKCREKPCGREVKGPTPCSVGLLAKSAGNFANADLVKELEQDLRAETYASFVRVHKEYETKNRVILEQEQMQLKGNIRYRVQRALEFYENGIEQRRIKLRDLLEAEEKDYMNQLSLLGETPLERQAKMRQHVKDLKIKREQERQKLVAEKLDQQFREQCEELQTKLSHRRVLELVKDRKAQIEFNKKLQDQQKEEEQIFEELWEKDRLAKEERAEKEMKEQHEKQQEVLAAVLEQMAEANAKRMDQKQLIKEEAKLMKERQRLSKLEDERLAQEKSQKQKEFRDSLNRSMALKKKRLAKEKEEEQALDTKIKEQALKESADDAQEQLQKKLDLQREVQIYRKYLAQKADDEKRQEEETNRLIEKDVEKTWAKRNEQVRLKKEALDHLKKEVMETRKLQIQEHLEKNTKTPQQMAEERAKIIQTIEEQKKVEDEKLARDKQAKKIHQQDILAQIKYQKHQAEKKKAEEQREVEAGKLEEEAYQKKLQDALSQPYTSSDKIHPWRRENCLNPKLNETC
ncbi:cilia- and flagella-associated protein 53 [Chiloscyllium plagiosum]|uniref:cilia- and flagella-associated protein 53 n=1 Tax=Chiloscyllium plagiosum TaxID=36176 RepID=UPI001CB7FF18|nr:cilia- and flagella-associated protein 53 [Chiloscyllium plagiosum]